MRLMVIILSLLLPLLPTVGFGARFALVVGIDAYQNVPRLDKAVGDAMAMASKLSTLGFAVSSVINPDRRTLNQAISDFQRRLSPGDVALVHFSGHGVEIDGNNLLLPADIPQASDGRDFVVSEAIGLADLMERIAETGATLKIFVIDACRDNPYSKSGTRSFGGTRGLGDVTPQKGSFILYSAGRGERALDNLGPTDTAPTSVYTRVLVDMLGTPGMSLTDLAKGVRSRVASLASQVQHEQRPAYYDELNEEFSFVPKSLAVANSPAPAPAPAPVTATVPPALPDTDKQQYDAAQALNTPAAWNAFLKHHTSGYYADLGKAALAKLGVDEGEPAEGDGMLRLAIYGGIDFFGSDLSKATALDMAECAASCLEQGQCQAFTYNANPRFATGPNCFLKSKAGDRQEEYEYAVSGLLIEDDGFAPSFSIPVIDEKGVSEDHDILGHDLFSSPHPKGKSTTSCRVFCLRDDSCEAFSFVEKRRQCWLKNASGPLRKRSGVVSGVKTFQSVGASEVILVDQ